MVKKPTCEELEQRIQALEKDESERKQAAEALRALSSRQEALLSAIPDIIMEVDSNKVYTWANQPGIEFFGEDVIGNEAAFYFEGEQDTYNKVQSLFNGDENVIYVESWQRRKDGEKRLLAWWCRVLKDTHGNVTGAISSARDITVYKQAEEELRESEERYKNVVDSNLSAIVLYRQEEIVFANKPFYDIFGYEHRDLEKIVMDDLLAPEAAAEVAENRRKRMAGEIEQASVYDSKGKRKDGEIFDMEISVCASHYLGEPCCIASLSDISERKKSEEARRESESRFRTLFNLSPQPVSVVEMETGRLIDVNDKYCELTQYDKTELIGRTIIDLGFLSETDRDRYLDHVRKTGEVRGMEIDLTVKDGSIKNILVFSKHIRISGEDLTVTFLFDVTERKWLESQLQQAQKMESIGTLAGGIAHDFNNILSPIMIHSEMVMMGLPPESPLQQNMKQLYEAAERARDLVKQILTFARKQEKERIPIKISLILKEAIKLLRSSIPTTIDIQYNINPEQDTVLSDPTQLNQIIMNLCTNAAHAMEEKGGTLEVILTNEDLDPESANEFPDLEPGRYLKLTVRDSGHGIEPQFMDKIFDPYFTTKEVGKGTGMGLALIHGIVKSYGGEVTVQSEMGKGTSFHVYLPLVEEEADILETAKDSVQPPKGTERILLVDDEKAMVDVVQSMLENLGYKVTARTSSIEALEAFRNNPQGFDLVVTDMTMPNMTGKDLAKELMTIRFDIPIILCTGFSEKIDKRRAEEMGINAYVMKPIVMRQIANTIREVLDKE